MGWGYGMPWLGHIISLVFWIGLIVAIFFLIRWLFVSTRFKSTEITSGDSAPEILKTRYAKGEINREEFEEKKRDLLA
jgi:putative membrane protein